MCSAAKIEIINGIRRGEIGSYLVQIALEGSYFRRKCYLCGMEQNEMLEILLEKVEHKEGRKMRTPKDFEVLLRDLGKVQISLATLKRLWNYVPNKHKPREDTLDILAGFVGYDSWASFQQLMQVNDDSGFLTSTLLADDIGVGVEILLKWEPSRVCRIRKLDNGRFVVVEACRCKLQKDDEFSAAWFSVGQPMCATNVVRGGKPLKKDYRSNGLTQVSII